MRTDARGGAVAIVGLALKSLRNRKATAALTLLSIALAVVLLLGVQRLRDESRDSFARSVSGTDLVVGARTSPVNLLLASVFRIGDVTNNVSAESLRKIAALPEVAWTVPLSLGDSHRGFRVLGTTNDYFEHFRFGEREPLRFSQGRAFANADEAVIGAEVARTLGYGLDQSITIAHGTGEVALTTHRNHPFRVVGILATTGTPIDRTIHVSLAGIDAMHAKDDDDPLAAAMRASTGAGHGGGPTAHPDDDNGPHDGAVTAFLVGLRSRGAAMSMQRRINEFGGEPLTAILPSVTLLEVWEIAGAAERSLFAISALVVVMGLASMLIALLSSVRERRREMAVLRAIGARPWHVFALTLGEASLLTLTGIALGMAVLYGAIALRWPWVEQHLGLFIVSRWPSSSELLLALLVAIAGISIGIIPAYRTYRLSLSDGMTIRL